MFLPGRKVRFRGGITGEIENGSMEAVNVVNLESYLQGVVPSEMSSSWSPAALQAQAVAARTYATRGTAHPKSSWFDVFGDTRDQAYGGYAAEAPRSNAAVQRTAGEVIVDHSNHAVLAQYSSADGGWTVSGGVKYLPAQHDPYDGLVANDSHKWTSSVSAASISSAYPSIGTLQQIIITGRDGNGLWGGRVTALTLQGSKASVNLTGSDFQFGFGLRSPWFRPPPPPGPPTSLDAKATGKTATATWKAPTEIPGGAKVTGYEFRLGPGRHRQTMSAGTLTASVSGLKAGSYTVHVIAQSNAGSGPAAVATVVVKAAHQ
jgi:SpoIID/LytB domain protein